MILAINTSTLQFGLALLDGEGAILAEYLMAEGESHFGSLMPALDFLLRTSQYDIHTLKCLAVSKGPGSFTGLRVGLSVAKGLCHALKLPIVGISSLEALASQLPHSALPVTSILDSRKGECFAAQFVWTDGHNLKRTSEDLALGFGDLPLLLETPSLFIGNSFASQGPRIIEMLGNRALLAPPHCWGLRPSAIGYIGLKRFEAHALDDPHTLTPIYLRPPDIRPNPFPVLTESR